MIMIGIVGGSVPTLFRANPVDQGGVVSGSSAKAARAGRPV
jgi:hypothetical protein